MHSNPYSSGPYGYPPQQPPQGPPPPPYQQTVIVQKKGGGCLKAVLIGVAALLALGFLATLFGGGSDGGSGGTASSTSAPASSAGESGKGSSGGTEKRKAAEPGIGDVVRDGRFAFKVTKVRAGLSQVGEGFTASTAQGQYVLVHLTVKNIGDEAQLFHGSSQKLIDTKGRQFDADVGAAALHLKDSNAFLNNINPGNAVNGILLFDVPKNVTLKAIELHDSPFSGGVTVSLR